MIKKSQYGVGEQQRRDYNWAFNPSKHVFGKKKAPLIDGVKNCLRGPIGQNNKEIVPEKVRMAKQLRNEFIGVSASNRLTKKISS